MNLFLDSINNYINNCLGGINRFGEFLEELSSKTRIEDLRLINFASFVHYNFQLKFNQKLADFKHLKRLEIFYLNFFLTQQFLNSLFELNESLKFLKIKIENFDLKILKSNWQKFKLVNFILYFLN